MEKAYGKGAGAPRGATVHFVQVGELPEDGLVAQGDVDHAMMGECAHGGDAGGLLAASQSGGGDEEADVFAPEAALLPLASGTVEEGLPLGGEVAVASGDPEEDTVVLLKLVGRDDGDFRVLWWGIHLVENLLGQGLLDSGRMMSGPLITTVGSAPGARLTDTSRQSHRRT